MFIFLAFIGEKFVMSHYYTYKTDQFLYQNLCFKPPNRVFYIEYTLNIYRMWYCCVLCLLCRKQRNQGRLQVLRPLHAGRVTSTAGHIKPWRDHRRDLQMCTQGAQTRGPRPLHAGRVSLFWKENRRGNKGSRKESRPNGLYYGIPCHRGAFYSLFDIPESWREILGFELDD